MSAEEFRQAICLHCGQLVFSSEIHQLWTTEYGRDVCKWRELKDGEYQRHEVAGDLQLP